MPPRDHANELPRTQGRNPAADRDQPVVAEADGSDDHQSTSGAAEMGDTERFAIHLRETASSLFMYGSLTNVLKKVDVNAYKAYRDQLLFDCGSPRDPIIVMQIEQAWLSHT